MARIRDAKQKLRRSQEAPPVSSQQDTQTPTRVVLTDAELKNLGNKISAIEGSISRANEKLARERSKLSRRASEGKTTTGTAQRVKDLETRITTDRARLESLKRQLGTEGFSAARSRRSRDFQTGRQGETPEESEQIRKDVRSNFESNRSRASATPSLAFQVQGLREANQQVEPVEETPGRIRSTSPRRFTPEESPSGLAVGNLASRDTTDRVRTAREQELTNLIDRVNQREAEAAERSQRSRDIFRAVPGLRGDNFAQRFTREVLAFPGAIGPELGAAAGSVVDRSRIVALSADLDPQGTRSVLRSSVRETPRALAEKFDPRTPEGLASIAIVGTLGVAGVRQGLRAPVAPGQSLGLSRVGITGETVSITERVQLSGGFNRALGRQATVTTQQLRTGTIVQTTRTPSGLRVTDTFRPTASTLTRRVTGRGRTRTTIRRDIDPPARETLTAEFFGDTEVLKQLSAENIQKNIIRQEAVRRESGLVEFRFRGNRQIGTGTGQTTQVSVSELGPTEIISDLRVASPRGATIEGATREVFQRDLRVGSRTSRPQVTQFRSDPIADLDLGVIEQTRIAARTPAPTTTTRSRAGFEGRATPRRPGLGPRRRRGEALNQFPDLIRRTVQRPATVVQPTAGAVGGFSVGVPTFSAAGIGLGGALSIGAASRAASAFEFRREPQLALTQPQRSFFDFDVGPGATGQDSPQNLIQDTTLDIVPAQRTQSRTAPFSFFPSPAPGFSPPSQTLRTPGPGLTTPVGLFGFPGAGRFPPSRSRTGVSRSRTGFTLSLEAIEGIRVGGGPIVTRTPEGGFTGFETRVSPAQRKRAKRKRKKTGKRRKR